MTQAPKPRTISLKMYDFSPLLQARCFASTEHVSYVANTVAGLHFVSTSLDAVDGEVNHMYPRRNNALLRLMRNALPTNHRHGRLRGKRKYPTMSTRNSSGGEIDRVQERSSKLRRKTPRRRFIARTDGNSFVDVAVFVDDNSSPGDPLSFRWHRRRRGMRLPRLLTRDDIYFLVCVRKSASSVFSLRALRSIANAHMSSICRQVNWFLTQLSLLKVRLRSRCVDELSFVKPNRRTNRYLEKVLIFLELCLYFLLENYGCVQQKK